ncbi:hypothetical protein AL073_07510 [Loktanella sp. 1ANDIMAR09]|nr:hypothetical protein AL073_07510 [Loktanella sp. 1ANDIMAR09]
MPDQITQNAEQDGVLGELPGARTSLTHPDTPEGAVCDSLIHKAVARPTVIALHHQILAAQKSLKILKESAEGKPVQLRLSAPHTKLAIEEDAMRTYR